MDKLLSFTPQDLQEAVESIFNESLLESGYPTPVSNPKAFIWGGPPGAGKSSGMMKVSKKYLDNNSFIISGDDYRKYHPNFDQIVKLYGDKWVDQTSKWSAAVFNRILEKASTLNYNLQIEGTMRTSKAPLDTANKLLGIGYDVNFSVVLAPKELCWKSTIERYNNQKEQGEIARAVDKGYMNDFFKTFSKNVVEVFNSKKHNLFLVYARYKGNAPEKVFSSKLGKPLTKEFIDKILDNAKSKGNTQKR